MRTRELIALLCGLILGRVAGQISAAHHAARAECASLLARMRRKEQGMKSPDDPLPQGTGLGELVKKPPMPEPHRKIREGVFQSPDGKFYTTDPPPKPGVP